MRLTFANDMTEEIFTVLAEVHAKKGHVNSTTGRPDVLRARGLATGRGKGNIVLTPKGASLAALCVKILLDTTECGDEPRSHNKKFGLR